MRVRRDDAACHPACCVGSRRRRFHLRARRQQDRISRVGWRRRTAAPSRLPPLLGRRTRHGERIGGCRRPVPEKRRQPDLMEVRRDLGPAGHVVAGQHRRPGPPRGDHGRRGGRRDGGPADRHRRPPARPQPSHDAVLQPGRRPVGRQGRPQSGVGGREVGRHVIVGGLHGECPSKTSGRSDRTNPPFSPGRFARGRAGNAAPLARSAGRRVTPPTPGESPGAKWAVRPPTTVPATSPARGAAAPAATRC